MNNFEKIYAVDTNVILEDVDNLTLLSDNNKNLIIIPIEVIEEIDKFKKGSETINFMARKFSSIIESDTSKLIIDDKSKNFLEKRIYREKREVLINKKKVIIEIFNPQRNIEEMEILKDKDYDYKIINSIIFYREWFNEREKNNVPVIFVSLDYNARIRARSMGLDSESFIGEKLKPSDGEIKFIEKVSIKKNIGSFPDYIDDLLSKRKIKNIMDKNIPAVEIQVPNTNSKIYYVKNFKKYDKLNDKKDFSGFVIKPKNIEQKIFAKGILNDNDIIVCEGEFGSGKTLMALESALDLKRKYPGLYQKIIYIRRTVLSEKSNAEIGFLPGNKEEKLDPYIQPLRDNIEQIILKSKKTKDKNFSKEELLKEVKFFENEQNIEYEYNGHLRGRSITNAIVIMDEAQNNSVADMKLFLSRLGDGTKAIILGSLSQIDDPYLNKYNNGLNLLLNLSTKKIDDISIFRVKLHSVVRGRIANFAKTIEIN